MRIVFEEHELAEALKHCADQQCDECPMRAFTNCSNRLIREAANLVECYERGEILAETKRQMEEDISDEELFGEKAMSSIRR